MKILPCRVWLEFCKDGVSKQQWKITLSVLNMFSMIIYLNMNITYNESTNLDSDLKIDIWLIKKYVYSEGLILLSETGSCSVNGLHERFCLNHGIPVVRTPL